MADRRPGVLLVGPTPPPYNGMTTATRTLLDSGIGQRLRVCHLDTADRRSLDNVGKYDFDNIIGALGCGVRCLRILLTENPDIVYVPVAQNTPGYLRDSLFLIPARLMRKKVVVHLRGSQFQQFYGSASAPVRALVRFTLRRARRAIVLGENLRGNFSGLVPEDRVVVVPNGLDPRPFTIGPGDQDARPGASLTGSELRVLYLSSLRPEKGFFDMLRAVPLIMERHPNARFVLAGEPRSPEIAAEARRMLEELDIASVVEMPGLVTGPEKIETLFSSDIFVLPSHAEGQPWAILEAMAARLPVVATDVGCIRDMVHDGDSGLIVRTGDPAAIADAVGRLLEDSELRLRMGAEGRRLLETRFTDERFVAGMANVFTDVLASGEM